MTTAGTLKAPWTFTAAWPRRDCAVQVGAIRPPRRNQRGFFRCEAV